MNDLPGYVSERIQEAKEKGLKELDLSREYVSPQDYKICSIPNEVFDLNSLEILKLRGNKLTTVQQKISKLKNLKSLDLSCNDFSLFPDSISNLQNLTSLNLSENQLKKFPEWLGKLQNITHLDLHYNSLEELLTPVKELKNIIYLNLSDNFLKNIPEWLGQLNNLSHLDLSHNHIKDLPNHLAELQNINYLNLSDNSLEKLPSWLGQLNDLSHLDLSHNQIQDLPSSFHELQNILSLNMNDNRFVRFPESIFLLNAIMSLDLSRNKLTEIPDNFKRIDKLEVLNLSFNKIDDIPESIGQLKKLRSLDLSFNMLNMFPECIVKLPELKSLNLSSNNISHIPDSIGQISELERLSFYGNKLSTIPSSFLKLKELKHLSLGSNLLTTIPDPIYKLPLLEQIDLSNLYHSDTKNNIKKISPEIQRMKKIITFDLGKNPVETPPIEVVEKGVKAIKDYFRQLEKEGEDYLNEAKLLIIGEPGAGKTTLAKKIKNPKYQIYNEEPTTEGIDVSQWSFCASNGRSFQVNIWDFGGQSIYHSTHQFFLTKRSLYILVTDNRRQDTDFYYWLNMADLLGDSSPLLIVKNEKQERYHWDINEKQLRGAFPCLKEVISTNLATNRGLNDVVDHIKKYIRWLPHVGTPLPKTWVRVREELKKEGRKYISIDKYKKICRDNGFTQDKDGLQLSRYLHDLGDCLHFQHDPLLRKTIILNRKWATHAVYKVLDNKEIIENFGRFRKKDLLKIWGGKEYSGMHDELLQLMINFKLCYRINGGSGAEYIAPQLLSSNQPEYDWENNNNLFFRLKYEKMPKGILTQFIVVMHTLISGQNYVWKNGVILDKDQTKAEIIENIGRQEIKIRVTGINKKVLLAIINYEFDKIHASFDGLKVNKLIPCNCEVCRDSNTPHFYQFDTLRKFIKERKLEIQCQESAEMVDVLSLTDDVIYPESALVDKTEKQVYVSYSSGGESEKIVEEIEHAFSQKGITIIRDIGTIEFKESIKEFMKWIGRGKCVIVVIGKDYLKSEYCMYELLQIKKNGQFSDRIFPIYLTDAMIDDASIRLDYIRYWEEKTNELKEKIKDVDPVNVKSIHETLDLYSDIRKNIDELTSTISDMNLLSYTRLKSDNFEQLYQKIEENVSK